MWQQVFQRISFIFLTIKDNLIHVNGFQSTKSFLATLDLDYLSAQAFASSTFLQSKAAGKSILEVSRNLGLKSPVTLEKFYK